MHPASVAILMFAFTFGGALAGMKLRRILPMEHLADESRSTISVGTGLIATITALVLGLVTASAKGAFDAANAGLRQVASDLLVLDRNLARFGPGAAEVRAQLKRLVELRVSMVRRAGDARGEALDPEVFSQHFEAFARRVFDLRAESAYQEWLRDRALERIESLVEERWLTFGFRSSGVPAPFLVVLLFWLTFTFVSFGMFAPRNGTVAVVLLVCALSVASAVFLILELDGPFQGWVQVSAEPLVYAISRLGR